MSQCALYLRQFEPDAIDLNLGCPAKSVVSRGAGAGLLRSPQTIAKIFSSLTKLLDIPVTAKIRLGWDNQSRKQRDYLQIAKILEDNGVKLIAIHGRTQQQRYEGKADWDAIAEIKQTVHVPVIANGDVRDPTDIEHVKTFTRCDAVMIGRAAIGNPWIFSRRWASQVPPSEVYQTIHEHLELMGNFYGMPRGLILFRKHVVQYLSRYSITRAQLNCLVTSIELSEFLDHLATISASMNHSS